MGGRRRGRNEFLSESGKSKSESESMVKGKSGKKFKGCEEEEERKE